MPSEPTPASAAATPTDEAVQIRAVPAQRVVALREVVESYMAQRPLWTRLLAFSDAHNLHTPAIDGPCLAIFHDQGFKPSDVDTEVCLPISADAAAPSETKEFAVYELDALPRAATLTLRGPYDGLKGAYDALFAWIRAHDERPGGAVREVYHVDPARAGNDPTKLVTEIVVPLA